MKLLFNWIRMYEHGVFVWARWLPVLALGVYLTLILLNLSAHLPVGEVGNLHPLFGRNLLFLLLVVGPLFVLPGGDVAAGCVLACTLSYLASKNSLAEPIGPSVLLGALAFVTALGDLMPWHSHLPPNRLSMRFKYYLTRALIVGALVVLLLTLWQAHDFKRWLAPAIGFSLSWSTCMVLLSLLFVAWFCLFLRLTGTLTLLLITLPTVLALSYVTGWPNYLLVVPFTYALGLSLAVRLRRI